MEIQMLSPDRIRPATDERDEERILALTETLRRLGWTGRPVAVVASRGDYQALADDLKVLAAHRAGIEFIPAAVLDKKEAAAVRESQGWDPHFDRPVDVSQLERALRSAGHAEAAELVGEEWDERERALPQAA